MRQEQAGGQEEGLQRSVGQVGGGGQQQGAQGSQLAADTRWGCARLGAPGGVGGQEEGFGGVEPRAGAIARLLPLMMQHSYAPKAIISMLSLE